MQVQSKEHGFIQAITRGPGGPGVCLGVLGFVWGSWGLFGGPGVCLGVLGLVWGSWGLFGGPGACLGVLGFLWGVLGFLWGVLAIVKGHSLPGLL